MRKVSRAVCQQACSEVVSWCNVSAGLFTCVVADAARNQLTNSLVAEKARRLLGPSVAMRFADIILPDAFFYAYKADGAPLREKANAVLYCNWNWKSFGREERKLREKGNSIKLVESGLPSPNCYFCGHFSCEDDFTFSTHSTYAVASHSITHTCAQEERSGFHLTDSQSFL
jgi:hypothetical protein